MQSNNPVAVTRMGSYSMNTLKNPEQPRAHSLNKFQEYRPLVIKSQQPQQSQPTQPSQNQFIHSSPQSNLSITASTIQNNNNNNLKIGQANYKPSEVGGIASNWQNFSNLVNKNSNNNNNTI